MIARGNNDRLVRALFSADMYWHPAYGAALLSELLYQAPSAGSSLHGMGGVCVRRVGL